MNEKKPDAVQEAFMRGQDAWREGKTIDDNPYPPEAPYYTYWRQGWEAENELQTK